LTHLTAFLGSHFSHATQNAWKCKHSLLQNEEPCLAKMLQNAKFQYVLYSDETKTSKGKAILNFGIWLHHMKTGNILTGSESQTLHLCNPTVEMKT